MSLQRVGFFLLSFVLISLSFSASTANAQGGFLGGVAEFFGDVIELPGDAIGFVGDCIIDGTEAAADFICPEDQQAEDEAEGFTAGDVAQEAAMVPVCAANLCGYVLRAPRACLNVICFWNDKEEESPPPPPPSPSPTPTPSPSPPPQPAPSPKPSQTPGQGSSSSTSVTQVSSGSTTSPKSSSSSSSR